MIELNKIRSLKTLAEIKQDLIRFITLDRAVAIVVYDESYGWGEEDYEIDLEQAKGLLEQVERRYKSLSNHLSKPKTTTKRK